LRRGRSLFLSLLRPFSLTGLHVTAYFFTSLEGSRAENRPLPFPSDVRRPPLLFFVVEDENVAFPSGLLMRSPDSSPREQRSGRSAVSFSLALPLFGP